MRQPLIVVDILFTSDRFQALFEKITHDIEFRLCSPTPRHIFGRVFLNLDLLTMYMLAIRAIGTMSLVELRFQGRAMNLKLALDIMDLQNCISN
jgi:hypothetical protein